MKKIVLGFTAASILLSSVVFAGGNEELGDNEPAYKVSDQMAATLPTTKGIVEDVFVLRGGKVEDMKIGDMKKIASQSELFAFLFGFKISLVSTPLYGANDFRNELCGEAIYKSTLKAVVKKIKKGMTDTEIVELFKQEGIKQKSCEMIFKK